MIWRIILVIRGLCISFDGLFDGHFFGVCVCYLYPCLLWIFTNNESENVE